MELFSFYIFKNEIKIKNNRKCECIGIYRLHEKYVKLSLKKRLFTFNMCDLSNIFHIIVKKSLSSGFF